MSNKKMILIDGNSIAYASYHGLPKLTTENGFPTGALKGFINSVFKLLNSFPTHTAAIFDKGKSFRKGASSEYKSNRKETPEDLKKQFPVIKEFLHLMGISCLSKDGYEADDGIAILTNKFHRDIPIYIATRDKDLFQLTSFPNTYIIYTRIERGKSITRIMGYKEVEDYVGIKPEQLCIFKALAGDASDNIKGVPGIGKVTAIKLIKEYGDLNTIVNLAKSDKLKPPRLGKLIRENIESLNLSYKLGLLKFEETDITLQDLQRRRAEDDKLIEFYKKYELKSFLD